MHHIPSHPMEAALLQEFKKSEIAERNGENVFRTGEARRNKPRTECDINIALCGGLSDACSKRELAEFDSLC